MYKSELIRAQELNSALLESDIDLEQLLQPGYTAVTIHSNSTIFYANAAFCDLIQYAQDEIIGLNAWMLFPAKSVEIIVQKLKEQAPEPYKVIAQRKDGTELSVVLKAGSFTLAGEPVRSVLVKVVES